MPDGSVAPKYDAERMREMRAKYAVTKRVGIARQRYCAKPHDHALREAVLEVIVEEMGPSYRETRVPEMCPVIRMAVRTLTALDLTQDAWTHEEIAILMGVTRERVRQYECSGRARMVRLLRNHREAIVENLRTLDELRRGWTLPEGYES